MINRLAILATALLAASAVAHASEGFDVQFSGFGTLAATHSSVDSADYVGTRFQPNGSGLTRNPDFGPDSKLGGQISAHLNDQWSAVVQVVAQHRYDNSYNPTVEWANVKYRLSPEWSARVGRIALPSYLISESRFVGYANTWAHLPAEVYSVLAITSSDGVDLTYRKAFGGVNNTFQAYYGNSKAKLPGGVVVKSQPAWGLNDAIEIGSLTLRAGYSNIVLDITSPVVAGIFGGLSKLAAGTAAVPLSSFQATSAQANALASKYQLSNMALSAISLGLNYDPGKWFVMSEFVAFRGAGFLTNSTSWYGTVGYRLGAFTPFVSYARTKADVHHEAGVTSITGNTATDTTAATLNGAINQSLNSLNGTQDSTSIGVRWDVARNTAIKAQFDHVKLGAGSTGRFANVQAGFPLGGNVNLLSLSLDFIF
jgi:hypothetical protein